MKELKKILKEIPTLIEEIADEEFKKATIEVLKDVLEQWVIKIKDLNSKEVREMIYGKMGKKPPKTYKNHAACENGADKKDDDQDEEELKDGVC